MTASTFLLDRPGGEFTPRAEELPEPGPGEVLVRTRRTSICQSDVVIYRSGLPRIKSWPAVILHEASCTVESVGEGVEGLAPGDLVGLGCDLPCGDRACITCGDSGTGDWTSCPQTWATGHEYPGFARTHALLPKWLVDLGPVVKMPEGFDPDLACQLEPLACCLEGLTRVNGCIEDRVAVLIGAGSQSLYALQCCLAMGARKVILVNRGAQRLERAMADFANERVSGLLWEGDIVTKVRAECHPFRDPHFVMINVPAEEGYRLGVSLMGPGTVLDAHAGVKGPEGKPPILHTVDLNNDIHYRLQCLQATHGSSMRGIRLAARMLAEGRLPNIPKMTNSTERFAPHQLKEAIFRAADSDSLKVIVDWDQR